MGFNNGNVFMVIEKWVFNRGVLLMVIKKCFYNKGNVLKGIEMLVIIKKNCPYGYKTCFFLALCFMGIYNEFLNLNILMMVIQRKR